MPSRRAVLRALVLVAVARACAPAFAADASEPAAAGRRWNVLLLTADALRADRLGAYGYPRPTSPNLDAFAATEAILFRNAVGHGAWTAPGVVSLVTGLQPAVHGIDTRHKTMDRRFPTAVKELARRGWHPVAYQGRSEPYTNIGLGDQDLARYPLVEVLRRHVTEPFVLWYHLRDTHLPYAAREEFRALFRRPEVAQLPPEHAHLLTTAQIIPAGSVSWDRAHAPAVDDLYDACVRQLDSELGEVFAVLRELGLWERTIVVVTADHGEELLERGEVGHASTNLAGTLHQETLGIPLLLRVPGLAGGRVAEELAQPVDVMPTVFAGLGLEPWPHFQGRSLLAALGGEPEAVPRLAFSESTDCGWQCPSNRRKTARLKAVRDGRFKLIVRVSATGERSAALYDLAADPGETRDVLAEHPTQARRLAGALAAHERRNLELAGELVAAVLDAHLEELRGEPPTARAERLAETCDELAMLRYVYEVESPSLFTGREGRALWTKRTREIRRLLGRGADAYWACASLGER